MKKMRHEGHLSAASETYMPRLELAARLVSAVIVAAFMGWLPNRRAFRRAAAYLLHLSHRTGTPLVVMYADFDDFKAINDGHGHAMGDEALCQFAGIIRRNIRDAD
jgi:diguanylate cyclase (GGDEF)-like protein